MSTAPETHVSSQDGQRHYCYILELIGDPRCNYVGYTVNMSRRLRQHNGELVGGAKITSRKSDYGHKWRVIALVTSPQFDHSRALSCEWWIKHPSGRRRGSQKHVGSSGRIQGLALVTANARFSQDDFTIWIVPELRACLETAMQRVGQMAIVLELDRIIPHVPQTGHVTCHLVPTLSL